MLFREDSFAIMLINRLVFGDLGIKYLSGVLGTLIENVIKYDKILELNRSKVTEEEWIENMNIIMKFVDDFLPQFSRSARNCPISMRYTFLCLQRAVESKFGKKETPFALEFVFFHYYCPAIVNPKKYNLTKEENIPLHSLINLVNISKLLNEVAMNAKEKRSEKVVQDFIFKRYPMLLQHFYLLIDDKDITTTKQLLNANVIPVTPSDIEQISVATRWNQFLQSLAIYHRKGSMNNIIDLKIYPQSNEMFDIKYKEFNDLLFDSDWKIDKENTKYQSYSLTKKDKEKGTTIISVKSECIIDSSIKSIFEKIKEQQWTKKIEAQLSTHETLFVSHNYSENYCVFKLPFPLSNRDVAFYQWEYFVDGQDKAYLINDNMSGKVPRKKGMVRGQLLCKFFFFFINI